MYAKCVPLPFFFVVEHTHTITKREIMIIAQRKERWRELCVVLCQHFLFFLIVDVGVCNFSKTYKNECVQSSVNHLI